MLGNTGEAPQQSLHTHKCGNLSCARIYICYSNYQHFKHAYPNGAGDWVCKHFCSFNCECEIFKYSEAERRLNLWSAESMGLLEDPYFLSARSDSDNDVPEQ